MSESSTRPQKALPSPHTQNIFKLLTVIVNAILVLCIPGFISFRSYCQGKGYYVFQNDALSWMVLGFFLVSTARYGYYKFCGKPIQKILHPKYEGEQKLRKKEMLLKLSFDTMFYITTTVFCYIIFRRQYWFPSAAGGQGSCWQIFKDYPQWPSTNRYYLERYFMFHLGIHVFSIFQLIFIRRKKQRKFYEWMFHHSVASNLILFSMMSNYITVGVMILIIHDASDIFLAGARFYFQAHIKRNIIFSAFWLVCLFFFWIYLRLVVYPFCLLSPTYLNIPSPSEQWYFLKFQLTYLTVMASFLVGMHMYWTLFLFKSAYSSLGKDKIVNTYDIHKKK